MIIKLFSESALRASRYETRGVMRHSIPNTRLIKDAQSTASLLSQYCYRLFAVDFHYIDDSLMFAKI
jgi:hypothetical protein